MRRGRQPDPTSINGRIRAFYAANPGEWLTYADICAKFDITPDQARRAVDYLQNRGAPLQSVTVVRLRVDE